MDMGDMAPVAPKHGVERKSVYIDKITELTGFSRRTVYNWIKANEVDSFHRRGSTRIYLDSLKPKHWRRVNEQSTRSSASSDDQVRGGGEMMSLPVFFINFLYIPLEFLII